MNFINPLGRKVGDGVQPQACMCNEGYSASKGTDGCNHCGCSCNSDDANSKANSSAARTADRAS